MDTGVARKAIVDMDNYSNELSARLILRRAFFKSLSRCKGKSKKGNFTEGEEEDMIRAAVIFLNNRMGTPILIGRDEVIKEKMQSMFRFF